MWEDYPRKANDSKSLQRPVAGNNIILSVRQKEWNKKSPFFWNPEFVRTHTHSLSLSLSSTLTHSLTHMMDALFFGVLGLFSIDLESSHQLMDLWQLTAFFAVGLAISSRKVFCGHTVIDPTSPESEDNNKDQAKFEEKKLKRVCRSIPGFTISGRRQIISSAPWRCLDASGVAVSQLEQFYTFWGHHKCSGTLHWLADTKF